MNQEIKLSIIVPMYKIAPYVERCIRSLAGQDLPFEEYEIICVNDGSPDNCSEIVRELQKKVPNIILLEQENQGVSAARNNGMAIAKGKYLMMIDADDYITEDTLKSGLDLLAVNDADVAISGYSILKEDDSVQYSFEIPTYQNQCMTGITFYNTYMKGRSEIQDSDRSCGFFFKRALLEANNLKYLTNVPYLEDGELMSRIFCLSKCTIFIKEILYQRTTRPGSAVNSPLFFTDKAINGFYKSADNLMSFKTNQCTTKEQKEFMNQPIIKFTMLYLNALGVPKLMSNYKTITKKLRQSGLNRLEVVGANSLYTRMAKYYNINVLVYYAYWKIRGLKMSLEKRMLKSS